MHSAIAFYIPGLLLAPILCSFTKLLQILNRIKRESQWHIGPFWGQGDGSFVLIIFIKLIK